MIAFKAGSIASLLSAQLVSYCFIISVSESLLPQWVGGVVWVLIFGPFLILSRASGWLADNYDRGAILKITHLLICVILGVGFPLFLTNPDIKSFLIVASLYGCVFIFIPAPRYAVISDLYFGKDRNHTAVLFNTSSVIAVSLTPIIYNSVYQFGGNSAGWLTTIFVVAVATCFYFKLSEIPQNRRRESKPLKDSIGIKNLENFFYCSVAIALLGPVQVLLPSYVVDHYGLSVDQRDYFMTSLGLGLILSGYLSIKVEFSSLRAMSCLSILVTGICTFLLFVVDSAIWSFIVIVVASTTAGLVVNKNQLALMNSVKDEMQGLLMSRIAAVFMGTPALSGVLAGFIAYFYGVQIAFQTLGFLLMCSASGFIFFTKIKGLYGSNM